MSDMKCPFCGQKMICGGTICHFNPDCPIHDNSVPTEVLELLDRTRKELDVAKDALKHYCTDSDNWSCVIDFTGDYNNTPSEFADKALEQITSLEQKDVK